MKGRIARRTSSGATRATRAAMKSPIPHGRGDDPRIRLKQMMIPKCTGSTPRAWVTGSRIDDMMSSAGKVSRNMPTTRRKTLMSSSPTSGLWMWVAIASAASWATRSVVNHPAMMDDTAMRYMITAVMVTDSTRQVLSLRQLSSR